MQKVLNKREKVIFFTLLGVIGFSLIFKLVIEPIWDDNERLNREIAFSRMKLKKYVQLLADKDFIKSRYSALGISGALPGQGGEGSALSTLGELENIARQSNVRIVDMRPQRQNQDRFAETIIELRLQGTMEAFVRFMYSVENSLQLMKIQKFQLSVRPGSNELDGSIIISQIPLR